MELKDVRDERRRRRVRAREKGRLAGAAKVDAAPQRTRAALEAHHRRPDVAVEEGLIAKALLDEGGGRTPCRVLCFERRRSAGFVCRPHDGPARAALAATEEAFGKTT